MEKNNYQRDYAQDPFSSIEEMVDKFGFKQGELTDEKIDYRMGLLKEEMQETEGAWRVGNAEEWVDGNVDIIVIALGNLAIANVDGRKAFNEVMNANMQKEVGSRREGDPSGMSIRKPEGWVGPDHGNNHGDLDSIWGN